MIAPPGTACVHAAPIQPLSDGFRDNRCTCYFAHRDILHDNPVQYFMSDNPGSEQVVETEVCNLMAEVSH
jgi:hypothetical protein